MPPLTTDLRGGRQLKPAPYAWETCHLGLMGLLTCCSNAQGHGHPLVSEEPKTPAWSWGPLLAIAHDGVRGRPPLVQRWILLPFSYLDP